MEITEVRVKLMEEPGERLQAFCSITFDDAFVVRDLKIIEGSTGPFVAMPSRKLTAHCPKCGCKNHLRASFCNQCNTRLNEQHAIVDDDGRAKLYADIAHPINSLCREMIQDRVIEAFEEERACSQLPGYLPRYDDFDQSEPSKPEPSKPEPTELELPEPEPEPFEPEPVKKRPTVEPARLQDAEEPRGPHKIPTSQPQTAEKESAGGGFGAGIF